MSLPESAEVPSIGMSFDGFYRLEFRRLVGLAYVLTGNRSTAEDLANEALLVAHTKWETVSGYDAPGVWVRRVLVNRATSWRRRLRSEGAALTRLGNRPPLTVVGDMLDAERIWLEVRRLPRRQAQAVALHYLDEYSVEEVASVMGCGVPTVKTHLQRARRTLASRMEDLQ